MNKTRRAQIVDLMSRLNTLQDELQTLKDEESDYIDAMPESIRDGKRGEAAQEAFDALEEANDSICAALESLDSATRNEG